MIVTADCVQAMAAMEACSVDAIVCDPPYGLGFMGKAWDDLPPGVPWAAECLRVLKPGGHLLAFGGTRTSHRLVCAIEDAGFEIRDSLCWLYGSGFPKSHDVSKAIDKMDASTERRRRDLTQWQGWGTALKPAHEPIVMARKPLIGTVAANVLAHGTGGLNVDGCRIDGRERTDYGLATAERTQGSTFGAPSAAADFDASKGRWPANALLDPEAAAMLDAQTGTLTSGALDRSKITAPNLTYGARPADLRGEYAPDAGGASRFFYVAKASSVERSAGLDGPLADARTYGDRGPGPASPNGQKATQTRNIHPTVKPIGLMRWLVRLVTPPGGTVLDPFTGSGSTGCACVLEGFQFVGIEREAEYVAIADARIAWWQQNAGEGDTAAALKRGRKRDATAAADAAAGQVTIFDEGTDA